MASQRIVVAFLKAQARNRGEQRDLRKKDANPNGQILGKLHEEQQMFDQSANILEGLSPEAFGVKISATENEEDRQRRSENKRLADLDTPLVTDLSNAKPAPISAAKMTVNGKRIGRPPKMIRAQIEESSSGPAVATRDR